MTEPNVSSFEERILTAALKLAEAADDPNASSEAVSEIVLCARGILRRQPPDPQDNVEHRRRSITMIESRVEYDDDKDKP